MIKMIKMNKKDFNEIIEGIASNLFEENELALKSKIEEWRSMDNSGLAVINEPPLEREPSVIDPKSQIQVADENMPIDDQEWIPGNNPELGRAMRQMSEMVPEGQIEWLYVKLRRLIDSSIDNEDEARMKPRLENELD